jgi:hypothetical protein
VTKHTRKIGKGGSVALNSVHSEVRGFPPLHQREGAGFVVRRPVGGTQLPDDEADPVRAYVLLSTPPACVCFAQSLIMLLLLGGEDEATVLMLLGQFLLLDELGPVTYAKDEFPGAPAHPHRCVSSLPHRGSGVHLLPLFP